LGHHRRRRPLLQLCDDAPAGSPAGKYHIPIDFGAIGSGLPAAIGVAAARNNGKVMLIDGDGSLYQHIQELETVRRHGIKL
jgi:acetolactate synthase-1/2/3 large subunit